MTALTLCSVSNADWKYIRFQDRVMRSLAHRPDFRRLVIEVSGSGESVEALRALPHTEVVEAHVGKRVGSEAHGTALNSAMAHVQTEYMLVIDPDSTAVAREWDRICAAELVDPYVAIGGPYESSAPRYQNFPMVVYFFVRTDAMRRMRIDWRPRPTWYRKVRTRLLRSLGIEDRGDPDVGWRLPSAFRKFDFKARAFAVHKPDDPDARLLGPGVRGREYHWGDQVFFTHQGRSWQREFYVDPISRAWVERVCEYLGRPVSSLIEET